MRLVDVMSRHVATVGPDDLMRTAAETILWTEHRHLPVVSKGDVVGVLSERDFLRHANDLDQPVREVMSRPAITISSVGPAVMSMPTSPMSRALAAVTYEFPGPTILSTRRIVAVPSASAAIAAAPPER